MLHNHGLITPERFQKRVHKGYQRLSHFRHARILFLRSYVGHYYDKRRGEIGAEPLNLIFNAIRVLVPNLVMNFPEHNIEADFLEHEFYAELLQEALRRNSRDIKIHKAYRRVIVDCLFAPMGVLKTGISESNTLIHFEEDDAIDPGTIYTDAVDFDNFVFDPSAQLDIRKGLFIGDSIQISRQVVLDTGLYDNDQIVKLPSSGATRAQEGGGNTRRASDISRGDLTSSALRDFDDDIDLVEAWVPQANALITVPRLQSVSKYLRVEDYNGPDEGPYTTLSLTPDVPGNPLNVVPVGIWHDLHTLANSMARKVIGQAERQKDVIVYEPINADDAESVREAADGEMVATTDPAAARVLSLGGQQPSNVQQVGNLQLWFNEMAGNPSQLGGVGVDADSATEAQILQQNAGVTLEDMKDLVYIMAEEESRKRGWYLHTDPFIDVPLIRRINVPARFQPTVNGPVMVSPAREDRIQVFLTPEVREGDFLDYNFTIEPESLGRVDSQTRLHRQQIFFSQTVPAVVTSAQILAQMGVAFDVEGALRTAAKNAHIDNKTFNKWFNNPEAQERLARMQQLAPGIAGSQGTVGNKAKKVLPQLFQQGGQLASTRPLQNAPKTSQLAQQGANDAQSDLNVRPTG